MIHLCNIPATLSSTEKCFIPSEFSAVQLNVPKSLSESVVILKLADLFPCATSCPLLMLTILTRGVGYPENVQAMVTSFW